MKKKSFITYILLIFAIIYSTSFSKCRTSQNRFEYDKPEAHGFFSQKLDSLACFLEKAGSSSMLLMVDGKIIFEWGDTNKKHVIHSIRKSLLNALYGIEVAKGKIDTNMTLKVGLKLVLVHQVDTEKDYSFGPADQRKVIDLVFNEALKNKERICTK